MEYWTSSINPAVLGRIILLLINRRDRASCSLENMCRQVPDRRVLINSSGDLGRNSFKYEAYAENQEGYSKGETGKLKRQWKNCLTLPRQHTGFLFKGGDDSIESGVCTEQAISANNRLIADMAYPKELTKNYTEDTMKLESLLYTMPDGIYTRQNILHAAQKLDPSFKETQLRRLLGVLQDSNLLVRVGHNQYRKADKAVSKPMYVGSYSKAAQEVISWMEARFPLLEYRVWEFTWLLSTRLSLKSSKRV
ncbi:MAG: hypothetical protein RBR15_15620 [Sphaerochaeta sp.]|nr:hypothetical protein [Sphaerochaeta sp.]